MAEEARQLMLPVLEAGAALPVRAAGEMSPAELLADVTMKGLHRLDEILSREVTEELDVRERRLISDTALGVSRLFARVSEAQLQQKRHDDVLKVMLAEFDRLASGKE